MEVSVCKCVFERVCVCVAGEPIENNRGISLSKTRSASTDLPEEHGKVNEKVGTTINMKWQFVKSRALISTRCLGVF
jgi:hypothetical protein